VIEETAGFASGCKHAPAFARHRGQPRQSSELRIGGNGRVRARLGDGEFYFLEVNTRLQVEHGVTEDVTGVDLVEWMVRQAAGDLPGAGLAGSGATRGIDSGTPLREDPARNFQPCSGLLTEVRFPQEARVETWVERGSEVPPYYDPMIAQADRQRADTRRKLAHCAALGRDATARHRMQSRILRQVVARPHLREGRQTTRYLNAFDYARTRIEVIEPGVQSSVQDWPVGSGTGMSACRRRADGRAGAAPRESLLGNAQGARRSNARHRPDAEISCATRIALCGADMQAALDGKPMRLWRTHAVKPGAVLKLGAIKGGTAHVSRVAGGSTCRLPRQQVDLHARALRRPSRPHAAHRRHAAHLPDRVQVESSRHAPAAS
jgi:urea carboxylase